MNELKNKNTFCVVYIFFFMKNESINNDDTSNICYICFELLSLHEYLTLSCKNCYHLECLETWWKYHGSIVCPVCNINTCIPDHDNYDMFESNTSPIVTSHDNTFEFNGALKRCCLIMPIACCFIIIFILLGTQKCYK